MYSFVCPHCGRAFEELLPMSRRDEAVCPHCGKPASRNLKKEGFCCKSASGGKGECGGGCSGNCAGCGGCHQ